MRKDLLTFLVLEILATLVAILSFRLIDDRFAAAVTAGATFVAMGTWLVLRTLRWPERFKYVTFYLARVHLWLFALPMLLVRIRYMGHDWSELQFLGIPGPELHKYSEKAYALLMLATVIDLVRVWRRPATIKKAA